MTRYFNLLQDPHFLSPFAKNATANGFHMLGGKEDDITVLLAAVRLREDFRDGPTWLLGSWDSALGLLGVLSVQEYALWVLVLILCMNRFFPLAE